jgi:hypothetical protein
MEGTRMTADVRWSEMARCRDEVRPYRPLVSVVGGARTCRPGTLALADATTGH